MQYVIAYDIGTTGMKTCLFALESQLTLIDGAYGSYRLYILENGGVEQDQGTGVLFHHQAKINILPGKGK